MFGYGYYLSMREKAKNLPEIEVDKEEFIRLMMETGITREKAEFHAKICLGMGSAVMIGEQMVKISN